MFGASEQSALAIIRDHKDRFSEKDIQPLYLRKSILLVKKGNPKNIQSIDDLTRAGIGIIVNDGGGTSNTSGTGVWEDIAGRKGNIETVAAIRKNIILYAPNSGSARKALENQPEADVWITWADWAASNPDIGDVVEIAPDYVIWRDMNITVRQDANDETRRFAAWLQTDEATPAFKNMAGLGKELTSSTFFRTRRIFPDAASAAYKAALCCCIWHRSKTAKVPKPGARRYGRPHITSHPPRITHKCSTSLIDAHS